jgi:hypothetical protein
MKKCPTVLINSLLSKGTVCFIFFIFFVAYADAQKVFKLEVLPAEFQKAILDGLQKNAIDSNQHKIVFTDSLTLHGPDTGMTQLIKYRAESYASEAPDSSGFLVIHVFYLRVASKTGIIYDSYNAAPEHPQSAGLYNSAAHATFGVANLSFTCVDSTHKPHHLATTLKEMQALQKKYHCSKIVPIIISD